MTNQQFGYAGQAGAADDLHAYSAIARLVTQMLNRIQTCTLVRVVAVTNHGELTPAGLIDVQPLVNQLDGHGNAVPHGLLHQLLYLRLQGGSDAIIMDPKIGDIGMAGFASRDISAVKATRRQANPGSWRAFDMADGMYFGGFLNAAPVQYIQFQKTGIRIVSPANVTIVAPTTVIQSDHITLDAPNVHATGNIKADGQIDDAVGSMQTMRNQFNNHTHPGDSGGVTGMPNQAMD